MATARTTPPGAKTAGGVGSKVRPSDVRSPDTRHPDPRALESGPSDPRALVDARFRALIDTVRAHRPNDDVDIIRRAWEFSLEHHQGQVRASGEPYVLHPPPSTDSSRNTHDDI